MRKPSLKSLVGIASSEGQGPLSRLFARIQQLTEFVSNSMKRSIAFTLALVAVASSYASPVPKVIKARYAALNKVMTRCDFKAFDAFFGADFVNIDNKGQSTSRKDFMAMLKPMFESSKKEIHGKSCSVPPRRTAKSA